MRRAGGHSEEGVGVVVLPRQFEGAEIVIATHNPGKVPEIAALLEGYVSRFYNAKELDLPEPVEDGESFAANARIKALSAAMRSGKVALADDSGLSVHALGGDPGIYSARWAGPEKDFTVAMGRVEAELGDSGDRSAAFICALCIAWPDGHCEVFEGRVEGDLRFPPRGDKGFGYDPIFVPKGYDICFAEMESPVKHAMSHRADAFAKLVQGCMKPL